MKRELKVDFVRLQPLIGRRNSSIPYEEGTESKRARPPAGQGGAVTAAFPMKRELKDHVLPGQVQVHDT